MLGSRNEIVLQIAGQFGEVGAVPRNADYESPVFPRIFLGRQHGFTINDIELHMGSYFFFQYQ